MSTSLVASVLALKKQLATAVSNARVEDIVSILSELKVQVVATEELIRETKIGIAVNKLRQNTNSQVSDLAKEIVRKWKADVGPAAASRPAKTEKSSAPAGSASPHPSALPSPTSAPDSPAPQATPGKSLPPAAAAAASTLPPASANATASTSEAKPTPPPAGQRRESLNGAPRTVKTDAVHLGGKFDTGDEGRNKCIELTYDALASDSNAPTEQILGRAAALEAHIYSLNSQDGDVTQGYRNKMRSLMQNLKAKNNPSLREDVVSGDITAVQFYSMTPAEMASEEQQAANRKLIELNLFKAQGAAPQQAETDAFQCGRCKQRRTMYYQMQTRSADEPMTTFVTCLSCNLRWKFS